MEIMRTAIAIYFAYRIKL
ncbi:hypothetical protein [Lachnospira rogosae (ex Hitch et al. 2025)]